MTHVKLVYFKEEIGYIRCFRKILNIESIF